MTNAVGLRNIFRPTNNPPGATANRAAPLPSGQSLDQLDAEGSLRTFNTNGIIFAMVSRISESVAAVDWNMFKDTDLEEKEPLKQHMALDLWNHPNPFYNRADFVETVMQHFDLAGESDWYVGYSAKMPNLMQPLELWPIRPDKVAPVVSKEQFIDGWAYKDGFGYIPWRNDEVIQFKRPNPLDPYRGIGPVAAAMVDVYGDKAAAEYNSMFFKNSAEPGGVVVFDERLPDEEYDEFVKRWREQHQGTSRAHRVAILERATWVERKYTMRDMEFQEGRKNSHDFIREAFGYPKAMLGSTEDVNKAAAIAGEYLFTRWIVKTRLDRLKNTLNFKLLPLFGPNGKGVKFGYQNPNPNDAESDRLERNSVATAVKTLVDAGYDANDVAEYYGLPKLGYSKPEPKPAPGGAPAAPAAPAPGAPASE